MTGPMTGLMTGLSLRVRATAVATLLCALVLAAGGLLLVTTLDRHLTAGSDDLSRSRVRDLLDQAASGELPTVLRNVNDDAVAQVLASDGTVLAASPNIEGKGPIVATGAPADGERRTIRAPDDSETEEYRVWVQSGPGAGGQVSQVTVVEGSSLEAVHEATATLRRTLLVGVPLAAVVLGLVIWLVLGGALARLDRIRAEVDAIGPDQLERRVPSDGRSDEVGRLAATMNRMLVRVDASAQRQRRLVADISHDLQGPLAAQRVSLELALATPGSDPELLRRDVLGATGEMERLVDDLLVLAAADEGAPADTSAVDLDAVVLEEAARARHSGSATVDTARVSAGPVRGNPSELRRVVRNLVDNAVTHAGSRVELRLESHDGHVVLDVMDDGPGVPADEREQVFERFHRGDPARTRGAPGTGLGLAIARSLAERAGGRLELLEGGPGARFRLTLPLLSAR
jgi:signal transduction histidine kinase